MVIHSTEGEEEEEEEEHAEEEEEEQEEEEEEEEQEEEDRGQISIRCYVCKYTTTTGHHCTVDSSAGTKTGV